MLLQRVVGQLSGGAPRRWGVGRLRAHRHHVVTELRRHGDLGFRVGLTGGVSEASEGQQHRTLLTGERPNDM